MSKGNKSLPEPMMTQFHVAIWRHLASVSWLSYSNKSIWTQYLVFYTYDSFPCSEAIPLLTQKSQNTFHLRLLGQGYMGYKSNIICGLRIWIFITKFCIVNVYNHYSQLKRVDFYLDRFRNGQVISSHTLLSMWLIIHAGIKVHISKSGISMGLPGPKRHFV